MTVIHPPERMDGHRFTRRSWLSLLGFVPSFVLAFVVGEGLTSALGYPSGGDAQVPWWAVLIAAIPALLVFALPAAFALYFGKRALRLGDARARAPMIVALVVAGGFILLNGISALATLIS